MIHEPNVCSICLDNINNDELPFINELIIYLPCNHAYHHDCFKEHATKCASFNKKTFCCLCKSVPDKHFLEDNNVCLGDFCDLNHNFNEWRRNVWQFMFSSMTILIGGLPIETLGFRTENVSTGDLSIEGLRFSITNSMLRMPNYKIDQIMGRAMRVTPHQNLSCGYNNSKNIKIKIYNVDDVLFDKKDINNKNKKTTLNSLKYQNRQQSKQEKSKLNPKKINSKQNLYLHHKLKVKTH